jgi:DeoR/GlpR family transcriptional regulator of sugar metabolism
VYDKRKSLILNYIKKNKSVSGNDIQDYISKMLPSKNSEITILRDLNIFVKDNKINKTGKGKNINLQLCFAESP